ncbi:MAG TPA: ATPase, T2SS/T4P/T4SS family [Opitutaceae bacterium]|jgi:Tfp pilus assembly pilus retraction ATPase PilT|nr:ATPase, T2SS/T4P/T4SS family [Opitutaceae bacterium]
MDWSQFFLSTFDRPGLSDYLIRETGEVALMVGKRPEFIPETITVGHFDALVDLIFPAGRPDLGLRAFEPAFDVAGRRFRVSYYRTLGGREITLRLPARSIPPPDALRVPPAVVDLFCGLRGGLVLVSGQMGSGKSTTVSSLFLHLAGKHAHRVVSIEDPVEFIYPTRVGPSMFTMRELDTSCEDFDTALLEVRRQHATAVIVGEIRGAESAEKCLRFALIGLLVVATIHGENVPSTLSSYIAELPRERAGWAQSNLAEACRLVVAQRLIRNPDSGAMVAVHETMFNKSYEGKHLGIASNIREGHLERLRRDIQSHRAEGMQTFEDSINKAVIDGLLPNEFRPPANSL